MIEVKLLIANKHPTIGESKMRAKRTHQISIYETFAEHEIGQELKAISEWLDRHVEALDWVEKDIQRKGIKDTGRMSIEAILRCGLLQQHRQWTYEELAFHLTDSATADAFARLPRGLCPTDSALQSVIALIRGETWECISQALVKDALASRIETLKQARIDSTITETLIHKPWDSSLLGDAEQILERLMIEACEHGPQLRYTCHRRVVKKQIMAICNCKGEEKRREHYLKLISNVRHTLRAVNSVMVTQQQNTDWMKRAEHYAELTLRIIDQTLRCVIKGERVPAADKVVSVFEPHTNIIVKDRRATKLNLTTGKHGMVLDVVIEEGNPAASSRLLPMIKRIQACFGKLPRQVAADAGYASKENISEAKTLGIKAVGLPKKRGMNVEEMTDSEWIYKKLKRFRVGIEGNTSMLKRVFGLNRCT
ncbi:transposase [Candidatus Nitrotoga arctica]|uniref:Transposase n=1 Tax=Candidatus Nitrotoga arctica TaxID=453162 RepID=A0ABM8YX41_9PROT|nr:transposase [Candidatus Nitrotoga arctica]